MLGDEGIIPANHPSGAAAPTPTPAGPASPAERTIRDADFFRLLGPIEVQALDCSNFEGAEILRDLNLPIPSHLRDRFDLIVDGGTLEHVFDVRQALTNIALMLRCGGRIIHVSPASNWVNHGFYQFSPTLFYDYYAANGFVDLRGYLAEQDPAQEKSGPWEFFEVGTEGRFGSPLSLLTVFVGEKAATSTAGTVPMQSVYTKVHSSPRRTQAQRRLGRLSAVARVLKDMRPDGVKALLARYVPGYVRRRGLKSLKRWAKL